jgi:DNA-directed RNA polymerase specialized sigma24 family protein
MLLTSFLTPQSKRMKPLDVSTSSRSILSSLFNDPRTDQMLAKFNAGGGQEDLKSELFAALCEKDEQLICDLQSKGQLLYYATAIVQRMIFQVGGRFHRRYRTQSYEYSEQILNEVNEPINIEKESKLQALEESIDKNLHWVEKSILKLHQDLGSIEKISKETKISSKQVKRIYDKTKEKLRTSVSGKLMGNYIVVTQELILDIPDTVTPDNINDILDETLEYMKARLEGRIIPSKQKTNGYIKEIQPLRVKKLI